MSKSKKLSVVSSAITNAGVSPQRISKPDAKANNARSISKQSRVVTMLQSPSGATIAAMMQATDWQQHSVRGFLAGVVRKRLKLKLASSKVDGTRVYQISAKPARRSKSRRSKHQSS